MVKIVGKVIDVLLIAIIFFLVAYLVLKFTNQISIYKVKTGSMEDNIHVGDYILIMQKSNYSVGDVVTYQKDNGYITHRIVKIDGDIITTKGDANNVEDDDIDSTKIIGKAVICGGILNFIINYKFILVGGVLSLYLFSCYFRENKEGKEKTEKNKVKKVENDED